MSSMDLEDSYKLFKSCTYYPGSGDLHEEENLPFQENVYMNRKALQLRKRKKMLCLLDSSSSPAVDTYCRTRDILDHARFAKCRNELRAMTRGASKGTRTKSGHGPQAEPKSLLEVCQLKTPDEKLNRGLAEPERRTRDHQPDKG